jgi:hypothetical protein
VPRGLWIGRVAGAAMMIWGVSILAARFH